MCNPNLEIRKLLTIGLEAEILAEKRHDVILETIGDRAGVGAGINLKSIGDPVLIQDVVELAGIDP